MKPVWLEHYPPGVPAAVDTARFASLVDLFEQSCSKFGAKPAFTSMGATLSYAETGRLSRHFAAYLQSLGLKPGERVAFIKELRHTRFTAITGVTTLYRMLLDAPDFARVKAANGDALKVAVAGGMALHPVVAERWQNLMDVPLIEGYGLTEASPIVCANPMNITGFTGSIGLPLPSTEVRLRGDDGHEVALGETGELCVRGPQVMRGYWNLPEETTRVLDAEGWLVTGDVVSMDARGCLYFVDRKKDVINVSGFKVWPGEVEEVLLHLPGIKEAGVAGMLDEKSGEAVWAWVVKSDPALTEQQIIDACHAQLAHYKTPHRILFRDKLPKSPIGKILRRKLKEDIA